jgi:hypothetical protein
MWCHYNDEQEQMEKTFPDAVSLSGDTPQAKQIAQAERFLNWKCKRDTNELNTNERGNDDN